MFFNNNSHNDFLYKYIIFFIISPYCVFTFLRTFWHTWSTDIIVLITTWVTLSWPYGILAFSWTLRWSWPRWWWRTCCGSWRWSTCCCGWWGWNINRETFSTNVNVCITTRITFSCIDGFLHIIKYVKHRKFCKLLGKWLLCKSIHTYLFKKPFYDRPQKIFSLGINFQVWKTKTKPY